MKPSSPAHALARRLLALPEPAMRERVLLEYLTAAEPTQAVPVLDEIYRRGREGGPPFNIALLTVASTLSSGVLGYALTARLYEAAKQQECVALAELFFSNRSSAPLAEERESRDQPLTLGHRKSMARCSLRSTLDRLLRSPEPEVIHHLLENPRITEQDVVVLASRRPAQPPVQQEIFAARRWISRYRVKRALVLNPGTPTDLALRLLGLLRRDDLQLVADTPTLGRPLREAALRLLRRPAAHSTDAQSTDAQSADAQSADAQSADAQSTDAQSTDAQSTDAQSVDIDD